MVQHAYDFTPYPNNILLTRCIILYTSEEIIATSILQRLYYQLEETAVALWQDSNNCGLDSEWNKDLFQHIMLSKAEYELVELLRRFKSMECQNENTGPCGNENRVMIILT